MQTVIDNILLNYEIHGLENKNTILILHGWGQNISHWQIVAKSLSQKNRVILLDLPGFGSSSVPLHAFSTKDYSDLVLRFIKKINIGNLILIGHSVGGKIAIKMATGVKNINKLILIAPSGIGSKPLLTKIKIVFFKFIKPLSFLISNSFRQKILKYFSSKDYTSAGALRETFLRIVNEHVENDAIQINTPTLIIWGENDKEVNIKNSKILKSLIPNSILRIIWKTGHSPNMEAPEKLSGLILEYI